MGLRPICGVTLAEAAQLYQKEDSHVLEILMAQAGKTEPSGRNKTNTTQINQHHHELEKGTTLEGPQEESKQKRPSHLASGPPRSATS